MNTFAEVVRARAEDGRVGVVFGGERWTWAQVVQEAARRAQALDGARIAANAGWATPARRSGRPW